MHELLLRITQSAETDTKTLAYNVEEQEKGLITAAVVRHINGNDTEGVTFKHPNQF